MSQPIWSALEDAPANRSFYKLIETSQLVPLTPNAKDNQVSLAPRIDDLPRQIALSDSALPTPAPADRSISQTIPSPELNGTSAINAATTTPAAIPSDVFATDQNAPNTPITVSPAEPREPVTLPAAVASDQLAPSPGSNSNAIMAELQSVTVFHRRA